MTAMPRTVQNLAIAVLIGLAAVSDSSARELPQRRPARPSTDLSNALGSLGLLPESIQSILLLYSGKNLSRSKADGLEADLRKTPDNIDNRLRLIGYYSANGKTAMDMLRQRTHVLWMIENHPEHPATAEPSLRDLPDDPEGNEKILAVWNGNLETRGEELPVLVNAEKFFFGKNPAEADRIIHRLSEREPNNPKWPGELAQLYRMFGIPGQNFEAPEEKAAEVYKRVLELTRNRTSREALAGEMADAAFKIGDFPGAATLAKIHLQSLDRSAIQRANTILGRVAVRSGDLAGGSKYLIASSRPEAAQYVAVFGPTMMLAEELLEQGERDTVLQYLENCLPLWPRGENTLNIWIADLKSGRTPRFGYLGANSAQSR